MNIPEEQRRALFEDFMKIWNLLYVPELVANKDMSLFECGRKFQKLWSEYELCDFLKRFIEAYDVPTGKKPICLNEEQIAGHFEAFKKHWEKEYVPKMVDRDIPEFDLGRFYQDLWNDWEVHEELSYWENSGQ